MMDPNGWDERDQQMSTVVAEDFQRFLDMSAMGNMEDGMDFDFGSLDNPSTQNMMSLESNCADASLPRQARQMDLIQHHAGHGGRQAFPQPLPVSHPLVTTPLMNGSPNGNAIDNIDAQIQYLQQQKFQQQQRQLMEQQRTLFYMNSHNHSIPPTPHSLEMPPGSGHVYPQPQPMSGHGQYDSNYQQQNRDQDMIFTPLVSPAVTPLDPHFNVDHVFAQPGTYFSPLTSPALRAQTDDGSVRDHSTNSNNSPIDMDVELPVTATTSTNSDLAKKARKNNAAKARGKPSIKSSPITKPQRKKTGPSPAILSQVLSEVDESRTPMAEPVLLQLPVASTDASEDNASVSPENLNEMPPPPIPTRRSASKSPYIQPQNNQAATMAARSSNHPATPASLMNLPSTKPRKHPVDQHEWHSTDDVGSLLLPEASSTAAPTSLTPGGVYPSIITSDHSKTSLTSQPSVSSVPFAAPQAASAEVSPRIKPGVSNQSAKQTPKHSSRGSRGRPTGSVPVSPALLPRISPNIKPLLPAGSGTSAADDTASRLLLSKSNYQNLVEGNSVPGVSYPSDLTTNLTSKRTSHKLAEQGRRNRINTALQVMAGLLPEDECGEEIEEITDKKDGKQMNSQNSKASVVEQAILHMQRLQQENADLKKELLAAKDSLQSEKASS